MTIIEQTPFAVSQLPPMDERHASADLGAEFRVPNKSAEPAERSFSLQSRSSSVDSSGWYIRDADMEDSTADKVTAPTSSLPTTASERWKKSLKLVAKGIAFSRTFSTLRDMTAENYIDPSRLTKIKDLGVGGFATVELSWLAAENDDPPIQVAVKRLHYQALRSKKDLECFMNEAATLRKLKHTNIAGYVGVGNLSVEIISTQGAHMTAADARQMLKSTYLVQQYVQGGALKDVVIDQMLSSKPLYSDQEACTWMRQVADGLAYMHSSNPMVMHRDLKLDNILLRSRDGGSREACLVDFGLSVLLPNNSVQTTDSTRSALPKPMASTSTIGKSNYDDLSHQIEDNLNQAEVALSHCRSLTKGGNAVTNLEAGFEAKKHDLSGMAGSFMYMAPEVFNSQAYNEKADVFSFGCCLQEVFSRVVTSTVVVGPTGNPAAPKVYGLKVAGGFRRPLAKTIPIPIKDIITECWAQEPDQRPDMATVVQRISALEASGIFLPKSTKVAAKKRESASKESNEGDIHSATSSGCCGCSIM